MPTPTPAVPSTDPNAPEATEPAPRQCPWGNAAEPTTLLAFLACDAAPDRDASLAAIGGPIGAAAGPRSIHPPDARMQWAGILEDGHGPVLAWLEAAETPEPDPQIPVPAAVGACRWVIGVQALIAAPAIADRFSSLIRGAASLPSVEAILDPATGRWIAGESLDAARDATWLAPGDWGWSTRGVRRPGSDSVWLFTEGLHRWGRPELELLEVPAPLAAAGAALLDLLAPLLVEASPPPDTRWQVGPSAWVTLQEIDEVLSRLPRHAPGSGADRQRMFGDRGGVRAAVCDPSPRGAYTRAWVPPQALLEEILRGGGEFFRSRQDAAIARAAGRRRVADWVRLLAGLEGAMEEGVRVRLRIEAEDDASRGLRSLELSEIAGDRLIAMPLDPATGAALLAPAVAVPIARLEADLADWVVLWRGRSYAAEEIEAFRRDWTESRGPEAAP